MTNDVTTSNLPPSASYGSAWRMAPAGLAGGLAMGALKLAPATLFGLEKGLAAQVFWLLGAAAFGAAVGLGLASSRQDASAKKRAIGGAAGAALGQAAGYAAFRACLSDAAFGKLASIFVLLPTFLPLAGGLLGAISLGLGAGLGAAFGGGKTGGAPRLLLALPTASILAPMIAAILPGGGQPFFVFLRSGLAGCIYLILFLKLSAPPASTGSIVKRALKSAAKAAIVLAVCLAVLIASIAAGVVGKQSAVAGFFKAQSGLRGWLAPPGKTAALSGQIDCPDCGSGKTLLIAFDAQALANLAFHIEAIARPEMDGSFALEELPIGKRLIVIGWHSGADASGKQAVRVAFYDGNPFVPAKRGAAGASLHFYSPDIAEWTAPEWRTHEQGGATLSGSVNLGDRDEGPIYVLAFRTPDDILLPWFGALPISAARLERPGDFTLERLPRNEPIYLYAAINKENLPWTEIQHSLAPYSLNPVVLDGSGGQRADFIIHDLEADLLSEKSAPEDKKQNAQDSPIQFEDVTVDSGVSFVHSSGEHVFYMPEAFGPGVCAFDYDGDGLDDVYIVNGTPEGQDPMGGDPTSKLFHNLGDMKFEDVTAGSGLDVVFQGIGCSAADYDGDGLEDLYATTMGKDRLFKSLGGGKFEETTEKAGINHSGHNIQAVFFDIDNDGDLDLFVTDYIKFDYSMKRIRPSLRALGPDLIFLPTLDPNSYEGAPNTLYENRGDGTFKDITELASVGGNEAGKSKSLGAMVADLNGDGNTDLYVANDSTENRLYLGNGDGTFSETSREYGVNDVRGSMGVSFGDFNNDRRLDLISTHYMSETNGLYEGEGSGRFRDLWLNAPVSAPSLREVAWHTGFVDFDNDGWPDIFINNGHLSIHDQKPGWEKKKIPLIPQKNTLLRNLNGKQFINLTDSSGQAMQMMDVSRGGAFSDFDHDGRVDILVGNNNGPARLLRNVSPNAGNWIEIRLIGVKSNSDAVGAHIYLETDGLKLMRVVGNSSGYASKNSATAHFGLGQAAAVSKVEVVWPGGRKQSLGSLEINKVYTIMEYDE